jgi:hypothetical protein
MPRRSFLPSRGALLGTALTGLLFVAALAAAESAWVLWLGTGTGYTPLGAYGGASGEKDCKDAAAQMMATMKGNSKQLTEFLKSSSRYVCLPETIDPRGPRGPK